MRLPGRERDLVAGFLAAEGILRHPDDLVGVEPCRDPRTGRPEPNIWNAALTEGVAFDPRTSRFGVVTAACGLCGTRTLEDLERRVPPPAALPPALPGGFLEQGFRRMRRTQEVFARTAGVHAAALVETAGAWLDLAEDVGRHNAVDKVLGARFLAGEYPLERPAFLLVSGRVAFEIVQKAALAGIPAVAGVGAPTSLAVEAAARWNLALFGLVRDGSANRYHGSLRLGGDQPPRCSASR